MRVCLSRIYAKDRGLSGVKAGSCSAARAAKSNELSGICISPILKGTAKVFHKTIAHYAAAVTNPARTMVVR